MLKVSGEEFRLRYPLLGFFAGVAALPLCLTLVAFYSGDGYDLTALTVAFPYATLWGFGGSPVELTLLYLQFPLYGLAAGLALAGKRFRWLVIALATAHLLAALWGVAVFLRPPEGLRTAALPGLAAISYP